MPLNCWDCGEQGHLSAACPNKNYIEGTGSDWCGTCDQRTRLISLNEEQTRVMRCPDCHPKRGQLPNQHRKCACHAIIYTWDQAPCGQHQEVGKQFEYVDITKLEKPRDEDKLRALALQQVAESRQARTLT